MNRMIKIPFLLWNGKRLADVVIHQLAGKGTTKENRFHIEAGIKWLMRAQAKGSGGFARRYCIYDGWDKPYIETTGYIIPTLINAARYLNNNGIRERAKTAAEWLLSVQRESGAFCDIDAGLEQAFDTGQVLTGLIEAYREWGDARFLDGAVRAGTWLAKVQEDDGSWEKYSYNHVKHAYYVKVSAALLQLAQVTGKSGFHDAALKNIEWTLSCRTTGNYFKHMEFRTGEYPFLHTIAYVIEGLLDAYDIEKDARVLDAVMGTVTALKELNRNRDLLLCSQYDENWTPINRERCITGLAQWAGIAMRTYDLTGDVVLLEEAIKNIYYLKSKQFLKPDAELYGGLPGSVPFWGKYLGFCFPNWGVKFFMDALMAYEKYAIPSWREQETWVAASFRFSDAVVEEYPGPNDQNYLTLIEKELDTDKALTVLDVGCGKGKFIRYFRARYPHWTVMGVDPGFSDGMSIRAGSAYSLPIPDSHADVVLLIEVMQHIDDLKKVMGELSRVMKAGGCLVVGDRDPRSLLGVLKPAMETAGRWMYPWDSPFQEQWRSVRDWRKVFGSNWRVTFTKSFSSPRNRIPMSNRFYLIIARKKDS
jgi:SAM-dependent methyltransferase